MSTNVCMVLILLFFFFIFSFLIQATSAQQGDTMLPSSTTLQQWLRPITHFHGPNDAFWCVFGPNSKFFLYFSFLYHYSKPPQLNEAMWCYHHLPPCNDDPDPSFTSMAQMMCSDVSLGLIVSTFISIFHFSITTPSHLSSMRWHNTTTIHHLAMTTNDTPQPQHHLPPTTTSLPMWRCPTCSLP